MNCARWIASLAALLVAASLLLGCNTASTPGDAPGESAHDDHDHDHGDHPETYAAAIAELTRLRDAIRDASASDDPHSADADVHEVGHLLEHLPELAEKAPADSVDVAAVKSASERLLDAFGRIDEKLHGGEGSDYADESAEIDAAVETLSQQPAANQ